MSQLATAETSMTLPDAITRLLDELEKQIPAGSFRPREARRVYRYAYTTIVLSAPGQPHVQIFTRNMSTLGLGFLSERQFKEGERFLFSFMLKGQTRMILCCVRHARQLPSKLWLVGACFEQMISHLKGHECIPLNWLGLAIADAGIAARPCGPD